jgi:hypothetical protein
VATRAAERALGAIGAAERFDPRAAWSSMSSSMIRPARIATTSGLNGESPAAMRSAFTNDGQRVGTDNS